MYRRLSLTILFTATSWGASAQTSLFPELEELTAICLNTSNEELCAAVRDAFKADWIKAKNGDYAAQRNVAFCLSTGCNGATITDPVEGCAWRMVIQGTPVRKEPSEHTSYRSACDMLANSQRREALHRAEAMFAKIYGGPLPIEKLLND